MTSLVFTVLSIALFCILLTMDFSSVNIGKVKEEAWHNELKVHIPSFERAFSNYALINGEMPDEVTWKEDVFPDFGIFPIISFNGDIDYQIIAGKYYLCFSSDYSEDLDGAFERVIVNTSHSFMKGKSCGVDETVEIDSQLVLSYEL